MTPSRSLLRAARLALVTVLVAASLAIAPGAGAVDPTIEILSAPTSPLAANTSYGFTAKVEPSIEGATVRWDVNGVTYLTELTNPNGVSQIDIEFGPGGVSVQATLVGEGTEGWAFSDILYLTIEPDPTRLPDAYAISHPVLGTVSGSEPGLDMLVARLGTDGAHEVSLRIADDEQEDSLHVHFEGPEGEPLAIGTYGPDDAEMSIIAFNTGCGSPSTSSFTIEELERDPGGTAISLAASFEFFCDAAPWPTVGWVRYNASTPAASLTLPAASSHFDPVIVGQEGDPVPFPITNDGTVDVTVHELDLTGSGAGGFRIEDDDCTGVTLEPEEDCSFDVVFAPQASGDITATLVIESSLPVSERRLRIGGRALIPTTVSVPTVQGDTTSTPEPGIRYVGVVQPVPEGSTVECVVDDGEPFGGSHPASDGTGTCYGPALGAGTHEVRMRYRGNHIHGTSTSAAATFEVDPTTTTSISVDNAAPHGNEPVEITATVGFAGDVTYGGGIVTIEDETTGTVLGSGPVSPASPSFVVSAVLAQGAHHLVAEYAGIEGVQDPSSDAIDVTAIAPDLTNPTATAPGERILERQTLYGRNAIRLTWAGGDTGSGIDHYEVRRRIDDKPWKVIASVEGTQLEWMLNQNRRFRFAVRAIDHAGNASPWMTAAPFVLEAVPNPDARIAYRGRWRHADGNHWSNEMNSWSTERGATATFRFTGRDVAWVTATGPGRGKARVYVDGVLRETIDLAGPTRVYGAIPWSAGWATSGTHTVRIEVRGTDGRPRVDVDGFVITR